MDFMNLNQSAHGDREYAHILSRLRKGRKTVVGHWQDPKTLERIAVWQRVAAAWADSQDMRIIRFGDQMNNVAVTDGDKVEAEIRFGFHVDYVPFSEVMTYFDKVEDKAVDELVALYVKFHEEAEKDAFLNQKARDEFTKLEHHDETNIELWKWFVDISLKEYKKTYNQLGIEFDSYKGESFYTDKMPAQIEKLR
jgi:L-arabinose isomerase